MKEVAVGGGSRTGMTTRTAVDKEKTKIRERQRRSITTKIFTGLRKHGGYRLSPRADINEVLRQLASEAGWTVEPDGTTYRSTSTSNAYNACAACGAGIRSGTPTPTSSVIGGGGGFGGECSTTASPRRVTVGDSMLAYGGPSPSLYYSGMSSGGGGGSAIASGCGVSSSLYDSDNPRGVYTFGRLSAGGFQSSTTAVAGGGGPSVVTLAAYQQQQVYLQEARASNQNTPVGSPQRRI